MTAERLLRLILVGSCLLGVGYYAARAVQDWIELDQLRQDATSVQARVTWHDEVPPLISIGSDTERSPREYHITYQFQANGRAITQDEVVSIEIYSRVKIGSVLTIKYVQHTPSISRIVGNEAPRPINGWAILIFLSLLPIFLFVPIRISGTET